MILKPFDELDITDPIMFGLVFSNKHIAQPFIEHLLDIKIDHLETPTPAACEVLPKRGRRSCSFEGWVLHKS